MKAASQYRAILVTAPDLKIARKLAKAALEARLAACANLISGIESHYWWRGKLEKSAEILVIFKTTRSKLKGLEKCVIENHPYDTPEFVVLNITAGNQKYLAWLTDSVKL